MLHIPDHTENRLCTDILSNYPIISGNRKQLA